MPKQNELREIFEAKNKEFKRRSKALSPLEFYNTLFADETKVTVIEEDKTYHNLAIEEMLDLAMGRSDIYVCPTTFLRGYYSEVTMKSLYAFVVDLDGVVMGGVRGAFDLFDQSRLPRPTLMVNSGQGIHAYYVLKTPVEAYKRRKAALRATYDFLCTEWKFGAGVVDKHDIMQPFRVVGSCTKLGQQSTGWLVGDTWDISDLAARASIEIDLSMPATTGKIKRKFVQPKFKARVAHGDRFYQYCLRRVREDTKQGHRYFSMFALSIVARKCNYPKEQLKEDLEQLLPLWEKGLEKVRRSEITKALKGYDSDKAVTVRKVQLEEWFGWEFPRKSRTNGKKLKQAEHLQLVHRQRKGQTLFKLAEYLKQNPGASYRQMQAALKMSSATISRYIEVARKL